jgi:hypothetical protein
VRVAERSANRGTPGAARVTRRFVRLGSWDVRYRVRRRSWDVRRGAEHRWGAERRGARERRFPRWNPPTFHSWARSCLGEDSKGGTRLRYTVRHTPAGSRGVKGSGPREMRESTRPRFTVGYRLLTWGARSGSLSPDRD